MKTNRQVSTLFSHHYLPRKTEVVYMELRCAATTSLACKSETEVGFNVVLTPFGVLPHPSHARARRRLIFRGFRHHSCRLHLLRMQERDRGVFMAFRSRSRYRHLTCNSEKVRFYGLSTLFASPPPPSQARVRRRWVYVVLTVCAAATSLACKSETQVSFIIMSFQPLSHCHLSRMQE